ncbi:MAG: hypothetical protein COS87_02150 [Chloroflexi bacterium CG07_land_8_20_14_0_80_45_17]|nr:MAG: hypothetical protein COS87_02150 [Chloroflexi bacterium CG07_land_8_20_14_0_80_45_17]
MPWEQQIWHGACNYRLAMALPGRRQSGEFASITTDMPKNNLLTKQFSGCVIRLTWTCLNGGTRMKPIIFIVVIICGILFSISYIHQGVAGETSKLFPIIQNGKWGYIDKSGHIIIKPQFDHASHFSEGLAVIKVSNKLGYIDITGKVVIAAQFDGADGFSEGLAAVNIGGKGGIGGRWLIEGGKWGFIDKTGKMIIKPQYNYGMGVLF